MIISYRQDNGTVEEISTDDLSAIDSADIEDAMGGIRWLVVESRLEAQDPTAMRAVLWILRRRADPKVQFEDVDVPGWKRRLTARMERWEIDTVLDNLLANALAGKEDTTIESMLPAIRNLAVNPGDVDAALDALGKGHLVRDRADSAA